MFGAMRRSGTNNRDTGGVRDAPNDCSIRSVASAPTRDHHIFGVPGDFAFPINDQICEDKELRFIGSCNELNAAYAADGYARVKGLAALNTTYGPGELNALGGIAGAYAEHLPVFHLTGQPSLPRSVLAQ